MVLEDYKDILGTAASTASIGLILAPAFMCMNIWKRASSKDVPFFPLMEGLCRSVLILQQGIVLGINPMVFTHSIGLTLHLVYIGIYLSFCKDKSEVKKTMMQWSALLVPMIAYANFEDKALVGTRFANLVTAFTMSLMFYHLYKLKKVILTKDTKDLPFPILMAAWIVTLCWTLYGFAINKVVLQAQTGFAFLVVSFELSLFVIYPSKPKQGTKKKTK